jgi:hypothetical protein
MAERVTGALLRTGTAALAGLATVLGSVLVPAATASPEQIDSHARAGRIVARIAVDARDHRRDVVRYRVVRDDLVRVTVRTAAGQVDSKVLNTEYWPRGHWQGAARMDGQRGAELVVGTSVGAHTLWFTVLTWRGGNLVVERNPSSGREWAIDAAYNVYYGWLRRVIDGRARITERYVTRDGGAGHHWSGRAWTYTWRGGSGWTRSWTRHLSIQGDRKASRIAGWHVTGLERGF